MSVSDSTEGLIYISSMTFTDVNWASQQEVTVYGVSDNVVDGHQPYSVTLSAATSTDANYSGLVPNNVDVTNRDDDTAGFTVSPISGNTGENGDTATFTVSLTSQPTADVTIPVSVSDSTEGLIYISSMTFTANNWNAPQTVTVTGVGDNVVDGHQPYRVTLSAATSTDGNYSGLVHGNVDVTNTDDDTAGFTVSPISGNTGENGDTATFSVSLTSQPTANVTIPVSVSDSTEGLIYISSITFTANNWNAPRTVTITGVNDNVSDGNQSYKIQLAAATSTDSNYNGLIPGYVDVVNVDDDSAGFFVSDISGNTGENEDEATFTAKLTSEPTTDVTFTVTSSDTTEGTVYPSSITFTSLNWNAEQKVTLTGVDDSVADGNQSYKIQLGAASSTDSNYNGLIPGYVDVVNIDNDTAGYSLSSISGDTSERGAQATFTLGLTSQPTYNVTISVTSSDAAEGEVYPSSMEFTASNWNAAQKVTITGADDSVADGNQSYKINLAAAVSNDTNYNGLKPNNVNITNIDDDSPGYIVSPISGNTSEYGGSATFTVKLMSEPTADVTVSVSSSKTGEGTVSLGSFTFTALNWNSEHKVTVSGVDDDIADGNQSYWILFGAAASGDANYNGLKPTQVEVTNTDNDSPGFFVTATDYETSETGGTATFTVRLISRPMAAQVTLSFASSKTGEGTVSPTSLAFTGADWSLDQTVTVTGVDDSVADGNQSYKILFSPVVSSGASYNGLKPDSIDLTNTDNDSPGFILSVISRDVMEDGRTATFTVELTSEPTGDVTIGLSSSDTGEGSVSPSSITFTTSNWSVQQTITVTGVDDSLIDGSQSFRINLAGAVSTDTNYSGRRPDAVDVINLDDEVNNPPTAENSVLTVYENGGVNSGTFSASDPENDTLTYIIVGQPGKGSVSITDAAAGTFTYTPNADASGNDTFTFKVNDGTSDSNTATVAVIILEVNKIFAVASSNGSISPAGYVDVVYAGDKTFTITPDTGYFVSDIKIDGISIGAREEYTFSNVIKDSYIEAKFTMDEDKIVPVSRDDDGDGVPNVEEFGPSNSNTSYDGDSNGTADWKQSSAASLFTYDGQNYLTLKTPDGTALVNTRAVSNPSASGAPVSFPYGLFGFDIRFTGLSVGSAATLTFYLPANASVSTYYKYGPTSDNAADHWYEFMSDGTTGAVINGDIVTLSFTDGARGDDDLAANGIIVDDGGPATGKQVEIPTLTEWGMIILMLLIVASSLANLSQRRKEVNRKLQISNPR